MKQGDGFKSAGDILAGGGFSRASSATDIHRTVARAEHEFDRV